MTKARLEFRQKQIFLLRQRFHVPAQPQCLVTMRQNPWRFLRVIVRQDLQTVRFSVMTPEIHDGDSLYKAEGVPIMDRILDVGGYGDKVRLDAGRITVQRRDGTSTFVPVDDVAVLMLSEQGSSVSVAVLAELAKHDATAVVCDRSHIPVGIYQPIAAHTRQTGILRRQIAVRPLLCARLWQRIVRAKINAQAQALARYGRRDAELEALAKDVRRGDAQNAEGHAALRYWRRRCRTAYA